MHYVYNLQSEKLPHHYYIGLTTDLKRRMREHNSGLSIHTNKFKPWRLTMYIAFLDKRKAERFEVYLKSSSGRAFLNRHFK